jgi:hypothetical protein
MLGTGTSTHQFKTFGPTVPATFALPSLFSALQPASEEGGRRARRSAAAAASAAMSYMTGTDGTVPGSRRLNSCPCPDFSISYMLYHP